MKILKKVKVEISEEVLKRFEEYQNGDGDGITLNSFIDINLDCVNY